MILSTPASRYFHLFSLLVYVDWGNQYTVHDNITLAATRQRPIILVDTPHLQIFGQGETIIGVRHAAQDKDTATGRGGFDRVLELMKSVSRPGRLLEVVA
jgi:hypothetical protein